MIEKKQYNIQMQNYQIKLYPNPKQSAKIDQYLFQATGGYNWAIKKLETQLDLNENYKFPNCVEN